MCYEIDLIILNLPNFFLLSYDTKLHTQKKKKKNHKSNYTTIFTTYFITIDLTNNNWYITKITLVMIPCKNNVILIAIGQINKL